MNIIVFGPPLLFGSLDPEESVGRAYHTFVCAWAFLPHERSLKIKGLGLGFRV